MHFWMIANKVQQVFCLLQGLLAFHSWQGKLKFFRVLNGLSTAEATVIRDFP
jgi:hypothetical protein